MNEKLEIQNESSAEAVKFDLLVRQFLPVDDSKFILDACCGAKLMWFDKNEKRTVYMDNREGTLTQIRSDCGNKEIKIAPDVFADFTNIPFPDESFRLVVFDPPHVKNLNEKSTTFKYYGSLLPGWEDMIRAGFSECFRVLVSGGILIFKWAEVQIPLRKILSLTDEKPLFGQKVGKREKTHWVTFMKDDRQKSA